MRARRDKARKAAGASWAEWQRAWRALGKRLPEMRADLSCYAAAQTDRVRLLANQLLTRVVTNVLLAVAVAALFISAAWMVIVGVAGGMATVLDGRVWLANLLTGAGTLVLLFATIAVTIAVRRGQRRRRLERRYLRHEIRQVAMDAPTLRDRKQPC